VQRLQWAISLANFKQPGGIHLKGNNRWVKKAQTIPMVYFRKRLTPEVLGEINRMILNVVKQDEKRDDDDHGDSGNSGTMIVDAS
jgi:hypothetical protein